MTSINLIQATLFESEQASLPAIKVKKPGASITPTTQEDSLIASLARPSAYSGLYGFHKYWGKKPVEPLQALITALTDLGDLVVDPFLGAGAIARETASLGRRFIGGDVNPTAVRLSSFFLEPCSAKDYAKALQSLEASVRTTIDASYAVPPFGVSSHLLWRGDELVTIWQREEGKRSRKERAPITSDAELARSFSSYTPNVLRSLRLFQNGRINSFSGIAWNDLFSGRALRNIELLLTKIRQTHGPIRRALELTLTAAVGQMSKMVFAITSRGKANGNVSNRVEVGSWVIGYWRPETHFEINVWNCFESKAKKLLKALQANPTIYSVSNSRDVAAGVGKVSVEKISALHLIEDLPEGSTKLLITDPPHGDRIPYLELSEMWNAIIGEESEYEEEVVVSNAKGRNKTPEKYQSSLEELFSVGIDRLQNGGFLVLLFNSRRDDDWSAIRGVTGNPLMNLLGCFPMEYSATSVVQDNREGGMKNDYILVYGKGRPSERSALLLKTIPGWRSGWPE